jgi:hypothetical protein
MAKSVGREGRRCRCTLARRFQQPETNPLYTRFEYHIERRFRCLAEVRETAAAGHLFNIRGTGLCAWSKPDFLLEGTRHTHRARRRVHNAPNRLQVRRDFVVRKRSTIIHVPPTARDSRTCRAAPAGSPLSCRQIKKRHQVIAPSWKRL